MRLSLDRHPEQYAFFSPLIRRGIHTLYNLPISAPARALTGICTVYLLPGLLALFGGLGYAQRHLYVADLSHSKTEKAWHWCVAGIEAIPVLGTMIALVESIV